MLASRTYRPPERALGTIVALHGLMESGPCLDRAASRWAADGWTVLVPDLRGHGASPRWSSDELDDGSGDRMVADVLELVQSRSTEPGPVVAFGHSAGGSVAAGLVETDLGLDALILEDPFWRLPVTFRQDPAVAEEAHARLLAWQSMPVSELISHADPRWSADEARLWALAKADADPAIVAHGTVIPRTPWPDLLARASADGVEVQVITGTDSIGITQEHQQLILGAGGRVTVIDGASHFVQRTAPEAFDAIADRALARLTSRVPS